MAIFSPILFLVFINIMIPVLSKGIIVLDSHYYDKNCPQAEDIILKTVRNASIYDPKVPARLLRLFFHDCFIRVSLSLSKYIFHAYIIIYLRASIYSCLYYKN